MIARRSTSGTVLVLVGDAVLVPVRDTNLVRMCGTSLVLGALPVRAAMGQPSELAEQAVVDAAQIEGERNQNGCEAKCSLWPHASHHALPEILVVACKHVISMDQK